MEKVTGENVGEMCFGQKNGIKTGLVSANFINGKISYKEYITFNWPELPEDKKTIKWIVNEKNSSNIERTYSYTCKILLLSPDINLCCVLCENNILLTFISYDLNKPSKTKEIKVKSTDYNGIQLINKNIVLFLDSNVVGVYPIPNFKLPSQKKKTD